MNKTNKGLRAKILLGGSVLAIPLVVSLYFLWQYGSNQIRTATLEIAGIEASSPLLQGMLAWQQGAEADSGEQGFVPSMQEYAVQTARVGPLLAYDSASFQAAGSVYTGPEQLLSLGESNRGGDYASFAELHELLRSEFLYLADTSGLVLDPDLDSYYLMLALYQSIPALLDTLTELKQFTMTAPGALDQTSRLAIYALAQEVKRTLDEMGAQMARSWRADPTVYGAVEGYQSAIEPIIAAAQEAGQAVYESATAAAEETAVFDPAAFDRLLNAILPVLNQFSASGNTTLKTMIERRIANFTNQLVLAVSLALLGLAVGAGRLLFLGANIRRRSRVLVGALAGLADGDLRVEIPEGLLASGDELAQLAQSVRLLRSGFQEQLGSIANLAQQLALIGSTLAANAEESAAAIEEMSTTSSQVANHAGAQLIQTQNAGGEVQAMASRTQEANQLTQGIAAQFLRFRQSMEANQRRIQSAAQEARRTGELAETLNKTSEDSEQALGSLAHAISGVVKRTAEIQEIVKFILDVADRTSLLSMNAAIEAAHAGHTGRGFAVVADEIRKLAVTSAQQAQSIRGLVDGIALAADQTLVRSETTAQGFHTIREGIVSVLDASKAIVEQMAQQEAEEAALTEGLANFNQLYGDLAAAMEAQVGQSQSVHLSLTALQDASTEISHSMQEQKIGMEQATSAVLQVRDSTLHLARIMESLTELVARFKT